MRPESCKCRLGHAPGACAQTLFGINVEVRNGVAVLHGELRKGVK